MQLNDTLPQNKKGLKKVWSSWGYSSVVACHASDPRLGCRYWEQKEDSWISLPITSLSMCGSREIIFGSTNRQPASMGQAPGIKDWGRSWKGRYLWLPGMESHWCPIQDARPEEVHPGIEDTQMPYIYRAPPSRLFPAWVSPHLPPQGVAEVLILCLEGCLLCIPGSRASMSLETALRSTHSVTRELNWNSWKTHGKKKVFWRHSCHPGSFWNSEKMDTPGQWKPCNQESQYSRADRGADKTAKGNPHSEGERLLENL